jgi:hypothetical protein
MSGLRIFTEQDVSPVADLIWKVLHNGKGPAPASLPAHLQDLFFGNPWRDDGIVSHVYEDSQGRVIGFFGAVPRRMSIGAKTIRLAFGSNFVVDPESRTTFAAVQLVKAFTRGTQDVSITDSANEMSQVLLRSLGFQVVPIYSLHWARPLRPSRYALHTMSRLRKNRAMRWMERLATPICGLMDAGATRIAGSPFRQSQPCTRADDLDTATLLQCLEDIPNKRWLRPDYDLNSLNWVLDFVARRRVLGDLRKALVRSKEGKIVGWYIYSVPRSGVGKVLQIGAESPSISIVLDHLFYDAWKCGLLGLEGRMEPQFMQELTRKSCFFFRWGSWTLVQSNQADLVASIQRGAAFLSLLDGEWVLRHGEGGT